MTAARSNFAPWGIAGLLWVAYLVNYVDRQVVFSIFPVLRRDLGFDSAQLGLIGTVFIWVYSLCNPLVGRLADVYPRWKLIVASIVLWSLATLATGASTSVVMFLVFRAVMGVTEALYVPPALGLLSTLHTSATRSKAIAFHGTAQYAGIIGGSWFGGFMADGAGWRWAFFALAAAGLAYAPVMWWVLRKQPAVAAPAAAGPPVSPRVLASNGCYLALSLAFFALCIMLWMIYAWLPTHLRERMGLSMADAGFAAAFWLQIGTVTGALSGGALGDWASKRVAAARFVIICVGLTLCSPLAYWALNTASLGEFKALAFGFGLTAGLMMGNTFAACYDITPNSCYGVGAGTLNMTGGISGGAAIWLAGALKDTLGIHGLMFWAAAFAVSTAAVLAVTVWARFERDRAHDHVRAAN